MNAQRSKPIFKAVAIGIVPFVLLAILVVPGWRPRDFLAAHWQKSVPHLPDHQVLPTLRQLAELGDDQLRFLVQLLCSDQERLSRSAWQALDEQLTRWKMLKTEQSTPKVASLASLLAEVAPALRGHSKPFASDLATKLLVWPTDRQYADTARLVKDCDTILRESARRDFSPTSKIVRAKSRSTDLDVDTSEKMDSKKPGGEVVDTSPSIEVVIPAIVDPREQIASNRSKGEPALFPGSQRPISDDDPELAAQRLASRPIGNEPNAIGTGASTEDWTSRTTLEVIRLLQSPDVLEASQAMMEFRRRGFSETHLRFAQQLTSNDPQVRRRFAESLPLAGNVDVRPWLIWLSQDDDPDVRLAAVSIMSTSGDQAVRKRLRQMELQESNPEVLRQVQRTIR